MSAEPGPSLAMLARLGWAIVTAVIFGVLLLRCRKQNDAENPSISQWAIRLRFLALALGGFWALTWLVLALLRIAYPFELEWIGGAMRDHCERVLAGQPLYVPPGPDWFPYEYPPLYFWMSALVMRLSGGASFWAMRFVSICSTLGCAGLLFAWVRRAIRPAETTALADRTARVWGCLAAGLFLATYRFTGAWYDAERLDMLFLFLSLLGVFWLEPHPALSALAFSAAFLTKQQAVLFMVGGMAAFCWKRDWRAAGWFALVAIAVCGIAVWRLNAATGGWFGYYCFRVPLANGIRAHLARQYVFGDLPLYAPVLALFLSVFRNKNMGREFAGLVAMTVMGVLGSLLSRAHWGGDQNVLMSGYIFLGAAGCILAGQRELVTPRARLTLYALIIAQMLALTYRPDAQLPKAANREAGARYAAVIRGLEKEGEVLCLDHGSFTTPRHFQIMGLLDVLNTEKRLPPALLDALRAHRFAAIVTDAKPEPGGALDAFTRCYPHAECLEIAEPWVVTGYPTPNPTRRVWVSR